MVEQERPTPQRDERQKLSLIDYNIAMLMMPDLHGRESWSTPLVLAQWVATIRADERAACLTNSNRTRTVGDCE